MNFIHKENELPEGWDRGGAYDGDPAAFHLDQAKAAMDQLKERDPTTARLVGHAIAHSLLAINFHCHRTFLHLREVWDELPPEHEALAPQTPALPLQK